jgi:hypothetical protein
MPKALFGTSVLVGIGEDNTPEYWMNLCCHPIPQNPIPNPLGRGRYWGLKNYTKIWGKVRISGD